MPRPRKDNATAPAKKRKAKAPAKPRGGQSRYKAEYAKEVLQLCLLGASDRDLAGFFGVTHSTIQSWQKLHPEFGAALERGKQRADMAVARSMFRKATGYSHKATKVFMTKDGEIREHRYTEHYPPDTPAGIFWLKNRRRELWQDKVEAAETPEQGLVIKGGLPEMPMPTKAKKPEDGAS